MVVVERAPRETRILLDSDSDSAQVDGGAHTALLFPAPDWRISKLPGPMLLLLDFLRLAAMVLPRSTVAFSFSPFF